jgi:hypothetical protein
MPVITGSAGVAFLQKQMLGFNSEAPKLARLPFRDQAQVSGV